MKKLAKIDMGNRYYKGSGGLLLSNKIAEFEKSELLDTLGEAALEYNNKIYFIGTEKEKVQTTYTKVEKTYIPQILYFCSVLYKYEDVDLMVCLPNDQIDSKGKLIEELQNKTFDFCVNGEKKTLKINDVYVLRESQAGFFSLDRDQISGQCGVVDAGSYTTNIFLSSQGRELKAMTLKKGTADYFIGLSQALSKYTKLDEDDCERYFNKLVQEYKDEIEKYTKAFTEDLYKEIIRNYPNIKYHNLVMTGGGTYYYFETLQDYLTIEKHKSPIFANIEGMDRVAAMKGLE